MNEYVNWRAAKGPAIVWDKPRLEVTKHGQGFVEEPQYAEPRRESTIEASIRIAFGRRMVRRIILGYERIRLKWIKPEDLKNRR